MKKCFLICLLCLSSILFACKKEEVKDEIRYDKIQEVIEFIQMLPTPVDLSNENIVEMIKSLYDELTLEEHELVENKEILFEAQEQIKRLKQGKKEASEELLKVKDIIASQVPEIYDENTVLPKEYITSKGVVQIHWFTSDPHTLQPSGYLIRGRSDLTVTLKAQLVLNQEQVTLEKDVLVKKIELNDIQNKPNKVFAYMYTGSYHGYTDVDLKTIDVVNLCFASLYEGKVNPLALGNIYPILSAREKSQIRVVLCITGYSQGGKPISDAASTETSRKKLASSIVQALEDYHFDGIDLDWEYPGYNTGRSVEVDRQNYTLLMREIYQQVKACNEDYIVSGAFPAGTTNSRRYDFSSLSKCMDYLHLMTYDMNVSGRTSHHTALYRSSFASYDSDTTVQAYLRDGISKDQLTLGIAFYGKKYRNVQNSNIIGVQGGSTATIDYTSIDSILHQVGNGRYFSYWDDVAKAPYLYDAVDHEFITYDDARSTGLKCQYAIDQGLCGVMFWEYGSDQTQVLMNAIYETMR